MFSHSLACTKDRSARQYVICTLCWQKIVLHVAQIGACIWITRATFECNRVLIDASLSHIIWSHAGGLYATSSTLQPMPSYPGNGNASHIQVPPFLAWQSVLGLHSAQNMYREKRYFQNRLEN